MKEMIKASAISIGLLIALAIILLGFIFSGAALYRWYDVWSMEMQGKAKLAEASQSRQIQIEQAKGEKEAAVLRADAIKIVGQAAKDFPEYRHQEFLGAFGEALKEGKMEQIVYIPTESGIPITEAGRVTRAQ
jgi:regulator of protease activity HflC (stomatin/prohibitin superfamily)